MSWHYRHSNNSCICPFHESFRGIFGSFFWVIVKVYRIATQGIISEVQNLTECLETPNEAAFVSYFGPAGFPFIDSCLYFSSCDTLDPCEDCVTQDLSSACVDFCSGTNHI